MPESVGPVRRIVHATRDIKVNIHGVDYNAILIPENAMIEVDFSRFPEDDPLRRDMNAVKMTTVDLDPMIDLSTETHAGKCTYRLTKTGAQRLLLSL